MVTPIVRPSPGTSVRHCAGDRPFANSISAAALASSRSARRSLLVFIRLPPPDQSEFPPGNRHVGFCPRIPIYLNGRRNSSGGDRYTSAFNASHDRKLDHGAADFRRARRSGGGGCPVRGVV